MNKLDTQIAYAETLTKCCSKMFEGQSLICIGAALGELLGRWVACAPERDRERVLVYQIVFAQKVVERIDAEDALDR